MTEATILIADVQPLIRDGLAAVLTMGGKYTVVARTGDGLATLQQVQLHRPHLVLIDIHIPLMDGIEVTKQIKEQYPNTKILIMMTSEEEEYIWRAIRNGANGYIVKGAETASILSTIEDCIAGRFSYPNSIQLRLIQALGSSETLDNRSLEELNLSTPYISHEEKLSSLTKQERNIIRELRQGKSNLSIASDLFLTIGTVKNYLYSIYKKLNVSSRSEAIAYLYEHDPYNAKTS